MLKSFRKWLKSARTMKVNRRSHSRRQAIGAFAADVQVLELRRLLSASAPQFVDPHPTAGDGFGNQVLPLSNGNVVITSPGDNAGGNDAGAVYLFNGSTDKLISTLTGSHAGDFNNSDIIQVGTSNFVVMNMHWQNGSAMDAGAVTWGSGVTGVSGAIGASNSLIGTHTGDEIASSGIRVLPNGNYLVGSAMWSNGAASQAGAVTFGLGSTGVKGVVSAANSLVGSNTNDHVGSGGIFVPSEDVSGAVQPDIAVSPGLDITLLSNGNFTITSGQWNNNAGAVTLASGKTGVNGVVGAGNSLVGGSANDLIGAGGVTALSNGNFVVNSPSWANGSATDAGAVTWGNGNTGVKGIVSASNSLVGDATNDSVGGGRIVNLTNGNYVVDSPMWNNGAALRAGAVTFGNGATGVKGIVSAANSLVGSSTDDRVGGTTQMFVTPLAAASTGQGSNQPTTASSNSVTITIAFGILMTSNGDYLVVSENWNNGTATNAGAVTWGSGTSGVKGVVSAANSLVGNSTDDEVGSHGISGLNDGSFVVDSPTWSKGTAKYAGAVTFVHDHTGFKGVVNAANSLVGSAQGDFVGYGGITVLTNGNYVVASPYWGSGDTAINDGFGSIFPKFPDTGLGAVTWGSEDTGVVGVIRHTNSLIGSTKGDNVGSNGVTVLSNGNYVVDSWSWNNSSGAATWGDGSFGVRGVVSAANSLVGGTISDGTDSQVIALKNGNYLVDSQFWSNGSATEAGAVTFGNGLTGVHGVIGANNSLVGTTSYSRVGEVVVMLGNGNLVVDSPNWSTATMQNAGAVTFVNGQTGRKGVVSAANSLVGDSSGDFVGGRGITIVKNDNYVVDSPLWSNGTAANAGAVTFGSGTSGVNGEVSSLNSLVGQSGGDKVGQNGITVLKNGNYVVSSSDWANGTATCAGAVTFGSGKNGIRGNVSAANSLVGSTMGDHVGFYFIIEMANSNYLVYSPNWSNGPITNAGAVTFGKGTTGISGTVSAANSFVGNVTQATQYPYDLVLLNNANETFLVEFANVGPIFIGSQITGI